jgi:hypothetical protein
MGVAASRFYSFMACQLLSKPDTFGMIYDGDKVMTKIMDSDGFGINASLDGAALDVVPNIAGRDRFDCIPGALVVADKDGHSQRGRSTSAQVVLHGVDSAIGNMQDRLFISLANNNQLTFVPVNLTDTQAASLSNAKPGISQKQNKCSISKVCKVVSYSRDVLDNLLNSVSIENKIALASRKGVGAISLLKEGCINLVVNSVRRVFIQASNSGPAKGLCVRVHVGGLIQKLDVSIFREWRVIADNLYELLQAVLIGCVRPLAVARAPIHELQIGINLVLHGSYLSLSNANYIRELR